MERDNLASYPKKGLKNRARIAFQDESGISERPSVRRTWALKGKTPLIASSGSWTTRSVVGVITCTPTGDQPRFFLWICSGPVRKEHQIIFLKQLRRHEWGPLILIWDRLAAHRAKIVKEYIASCPGLSAEHFPPYAPELNPVEYAWATAKNRDLANLYPEGLKELDRSIRKMKRRLQRRVDILKGFLKRSSLFC